MFKLLDEKLRIRPYILELKVWFFLLAINNVHKQLISKLLIITSKLTYNVKEYFVIRFCRLTFVGRFDFVMLNNTLNSI